MQWTESSGSLWRANLESEHITLPITLSIGTGPFGISSRQSNNPNCWKPWLWLTPLAGTKTLVAGLSGVGIRVRIVDSLWSSKRRGGTLPDT